MPAELRYHYYIKISSLWPDPQGVDAYNEREAIKKLVFRKYPIDPNDKDKERRTYENIRLAYDIFERGDYEVVSSKPNYSDHFDEDKDPDWPIRFFTESIKKGLR